jgi:predicted MFS family arabinose efflux permease
MQVVVQGWLMFQLTGSAFSMGLVNFLAVIPVVVIAPLAGAIVDKTSARFMLVTTSILGILQASLFYGAFVSGHLSPAGICGMALAWGIINGLETPARFVCIKEIVDSDPSLVPSAMALNGTLVGLGFILGPSVGGIVVAHWGVGMAFFLNAISFIPMLIFIIKVIKPKARARGGAISVSGIIKDVIDGFRLCVSDGAIRPLILLLGAATFFGFSYRGMLPAVAEYLHLGPVGFGWLSAAPGIGTLVAAAVVSRSTQALPVRRFLLLGISSLAGTLVTFFFLRNFVAGMVLLGIAGFGLDLVVLTVQSATSIITKQSNPVMIGRVMGCGASIFFMGSAFGYLALGSVSKVIGVFPAMGCFGMVLLILAVIVAVRNKRYPAFVKG